MKNRNNKPKHWGKFIKPLEDQNYNTLNSKERKILKRRQLKLEEKNKQLTTKCPNCKTDNYHKNEDGTYTCAFC